MSESSKCKFPMTLVIGGVTIIVPKNTIDPKHYLYATDEEWISWHVEKALGLGDEWSKIPF